MRIFFRLGVAGFKVVMKGKTFLDVLVLFCRASFRDENLTSVRIVADRILFSACSCLASSGIMVVNFCLRASMSSVSASMFFSCCWIMSWRGSCSTLSQIFLKSVLKFWSGLRCSLGQYWRLTGQELLLTSSFRIQSDLLALARLVSG